MSATYKTTTITFRVNKNLKNVLRLKSEEKGLTLSDTVRILLSHGVETIEQINIARQAFADTVKKLEEQKKVSPDG